MPDDANRDLVLPPNTYAYVLDKTKGRVSVFVGPFKNSLSQTDQLVQWGRDRGRFLETEGMSQAVTTFSVAGEGQYTVLTNPAKDNAHPPRGNSTEAVDLEVGRQVNVPGPATFALWPGQVAKTIDGHHLRHNQYLIVRVYDANQAMANYQSAVVAPQTTDDPNVELISPSGVYTMGQLIVVKGTDVSFYIPPTGIEVTQDKDTNAYVREAVTLERLEYCILLDENGEKRYVQGPDVVFPSPTEKFVTQSADDQVSSRAEAGSRKFRAIELNPHSGLHIKVIADYTQGTGKNAVEHKAGEELFITGVDTPIYLPQIEHSIIQYGRRKVHHAIAIPAGEGRYVLNRDTGEVDLVEGPKMFLPDPRTQVVVLRVLDPRLAELLYPKNDEVLEVNERYRELTSEVGEGTLSMAAATATYSASVGNAVRSASNVEFAGDTFSRSTTYNKPRSVVLDSKYDGAVAVSVWPGYAVLVTNKSGGRRVEMGPRMVLLKYDEIVMPVELSTGRPKNDTNLLRTAYLRVGNNHVTDRVIVETRDLVTVSIDVSYGVNFEGDDPLKWFDVENYVQVMTDHCRSRLRAAAKAYGIQEFYTRAIEIVRDTLLGAPDEGGRKGLFFPENSMRVYDVEVLSTVIQNSIVAELLTRAQNDALTGAVALSAAEEKSVRNARIEELTRLNLTSAEQTVIMRAELEMAAIDRVTEQALAKIASRLQEITGTASVRDQERNINTADALQLVAIQGASDDQRIDALTRETEQFIARLTAISPTMVVALNEFGDKKFVEELVRAVGPAALAAGVTSADVLKQVFDGTPFAGALDMLTQRPLARANHD